MKNWFLGQGLPLYVEMIFFAAGLFALWMTSRSYKRLIHEADSMGTSEHRLMKYIRVKVTSCFKIGMRPDDVQSLVGRYIKKYRIGPMGLGSWKRLPYLCITVIFAVVGGNLMYQWSAGMGDIFTGSVMGIAILEAVVLYGLMRFSDFEEKEQLLMYTILDYVGNYMNHKLAYEYKEQAGNIAPEQYKRVLQEVAATGNGRRKEKRPQYYYDDYALDMKVSRNDEVDARIVEDVLKEFLC